MDTIQLSETVRYCHDSGMLWWEKLSEDQWTRTFIPNIKFPMNECDDDRDNPFGSETKKIDRKELDRINDIISQTLTKQLLKYDSNREISEETVVKFEEFLYHYAPWSKKWVFTEENRSFALDSLGNSARDYLDLAMRAQLATTPFLIAIDKINAAFDDGFYAMSNIPVHDKVVGKNARDGLMMLVGCYSRPLLRKVSEALSSDYCVLNKLTLLTMAYGLSPEQVMIAIDNGLLDNASVQEDINGAPTSVDGRIVIPEWVYSLSPVRRVQFLSQRALFLEVVRLCSRHDVDIKYTSGMTLYDVHNVIVSEIMKEVDIQMSSLDKGVKHTIGEFSVMKVMEDGQLPAIGEVASICVGTAHYVERFRQGLSMFFFMDHVKEHYPVVAEVDCDSGKIVEVRGYDNRPASEEEIAVVEKAVTLSWDYSCAA